MKKHTASLMTAAMLLTLAWMTGCDSGKTAESSKAATTTALETTAEVVTDAAETTAAEESSAADAQRFDNYADFAAAMAEQHPERHCIRRRKACSSSGNGSPSCWDRPAISTRCTAQKDRQR